MEQLIILLLIAAASLFSTYIQNKKKREAEQRELEGLPGSGQEDSPPPAQPWPQTSRDWQEELRRMLQGEPAPPAPPPLPAAPPVVRAPAPPAKPAPQGGFPPPAPPREFRSPHQRASELSQRVEARLEAADARTKAHRPDLPAARARSGPAFVRRWAHDRQALREAFVASVILAPPAALRIPVDSEAVSGRV